MEGLRDRINEVKDHYRLSNRGFAEAIGARPAATNNYLNGTKEPSMEFIDRILTTYVDISADWLLCGRGSMFYDADKQTDEKLLKELAETKDVVKISPAGAISIQISNVQKPYGLHVADGMLFVSSQGSNSVLRYKL